MSFHKGATVIYTAKGIANNLTDGHEYTVQADTCGRWVPVLDDNNQDIHVRGDCLKIKAVGNPHGKRGTLAQATAAVEPVDEEDYDTRKANQSVTSAGLFKVGTRLIYEDGTPTLTSLTVKACTATSVWFEETYSTPFNPNEFITER